MYLMLCFYFALASVSGINFNFEEKYYINDVMYFNSHNFDAFENSLYYSDGYLDENDELTILKISSKSTDTLKIKFPEEVATIKYAKENVEIVKFHKNQLFLLYRDKLIIFVNEKGAYNLDKWFDIGKIFNKKLPTSASRLIIDGDNIIGIEDLLKKHNKDSSFFFWRINLKDSTLNKFVRLPLPLGYYWSIMRPRCLLDYHNGIFVSSDVTEYKLRFYDLEGNKLDSLERKLPFWEATSLRKNYYDAPPQQLISYMQSKDTTKSLIHNVNFINDSTILVCYSHKQDTDDPKLMYHEFYDIWRKNSQNKSWSLHLSDIDIYDYFQYKSDLEKAPLNRNYFINSGKIYSFHYHYENEDPEFYILRRELK